MVCPFEKTCLNANTWRCQFCSKLDLVVINRKALVCVPQEVRRFTQYKNKRYYEKVEPLIPHLEPLFDQSHYVTKIMREVNRLWKEQN